MSKHTIGPWALIQESHGFIVTARDHCYDVAIVRDIGNEDNLANAKLIVSAPDLLDALRDACADLEECAEELGAGPMSRLSINLVKARAALSKAEGQ